MKKYKRIFLLFVNVMLACIYLNGMVKLTYIIFYLQGISFLKITLFLGQILATIGLIYSMCEIIKMRYENENK